MSAHPTAIPADPLHARAWAGVGLALAAVAALQGPLLRQGGLAPWVVAGGVGLALGLPAALQEARTGVAPRRGDVTSLATDCAAGAALAGGCLPPAAEGPAGVVGWALGALAVVALLVRPVGAGDPRLARRAVARVGRAVPVAATVAIAAAVLRPLVGGTPLVAPWAVLEPAWGAWSSWLPGAIVLGLSLPLAGARVWSATVEREPGSRRAPALTAGVALLLATGLVVAEGCAFESVASAATARSTLTLSSPVLAVAIALGAVGLRGTTPWRTLGALVAWTAWFRLAGDAAVGWTWGLLVPLALAAGLAAQARDARGADRVVAASAAALAALAGLLGFPGVPDAPSEAFGAAATVVVLTWLVGFRRLAEAP